MEQLFGLRKGAWTEEEDLLLRKCIQKYGEGKWRHVPVRAGLRRCRKSCRLRWLNYLRPNIKRGEFTQDEVDLISRLHKLLGNRWSLIAGRLPGRTANDIKNYWNTRTSKNLGSKVEEVKDKVRIEKIKAIRPQPWTFSKNSPGWRRLSSSISVDTTTTTTAINTNQSREIVLGTASPSLPPEDPTLWWGDVFVEKEGAKGTSCSFSGSGRGKSLWIDDVEPATKCGEASSKEAKGGWDDFFWVEDVDPMMKGEETVMEEGKNDWDDFGSEFNFWDSFGEEGEVVFIV